MPHKNLLNLLSSLILCTFILAPQSQAFAIGLNTRNQPSQGGPCASLLRGYDYLVKYYLNPSALFYTEWSLLPTRVSGLLGIKPSERDFQNMALYNKVRLSMNSSKIPREEVAHRIREGLPLSNRLEVGAGYDHKKDLEIAKALLWGPSFRYLDFKVAEVTGGNLLLNRRDLYLQNRLLSVYSIDHKSIQVTVGSILFLYNGVVVAVLDPNPGVEERWRFFGLASYLSSIAD